MRLRLWAAAVLLVAAPSSAAKQPIPAGLTAAESNAEDIVDVALAHNRSGVVSIARQLRATANAQAAALRKDGVPPKLVAAGDVDAIRTRVQEHLDAGATQVAIQPLEEDDPFGLETLRRLSPVLGISSRPLRDGPNET